MTTTSPALTLETPEGARRTENVTYEEILAVIYRFVPDARDRAELGTLVRRYGVSERQWAYANAKGEVAR